MNTNQDTTLINKMDIDDITLTLRSIGGYFDCEALREISLFNVAAGIDELQAAIKASDQRIQELESEIANLHTVMMAAAIEITEHWESHCDEDGCGPANLVRRLENGYPEQYGYDAKTMVRMDK